MKTKHLFFAALALTALASCAEDSFTGDPSTKENGNGAISFGGGMPAFTRADKTGSDAAADLNNHFYVYGIKKESVDGAGNVQAGNLVFNNYAVNWTANSAMTTTSNTENWEYVGYTLTEKERAKITVNSGAVAQTIKYWDWGAADYTFYAFSAKPEDISGDKIAVAKVQDQTTAASKTVYDNGYTVTLAAGASLDDLYFSERKFIEKSAGASNTDRTADNTYGGNVTFRFHNMASKVRVAMYETIPGHSVTINSFKVVDNASPTFPTMTVEETGQFKANFVNNANGTAGSMTVKYVASGATENHPTVAFTPTSTAANILALGDNLKADVTIGTSITEATYDRTDGADADTQPDYTSVFPKEDNSQNLKLKVCYTLTAPVTGETITVTDATAEIPANYLKWKPGYAYTYIFKISDNTNGSTGTPGTNPAGLYPITFDAVETVNEDGLAEYITTVSEPSITTFGVKDGKYSVGQNEYAAGTVVYATVEDASTLVTLSTSNMNLYTVTGTGDLTEAGVAEALIEKPTMTAAQVALAKVIPAASSFTGYQNTVPAEDGTTKTLHASEAKAAYFTTATGTKYALVYQKSGEAPTYVWGTGSTYANQDALDAAKDAAVDGKLYTDDQCTTEASYTWSSAETVYYTANAAKYAADGDFTAAGQVFAAPGSVATPAASRTNETTPYYKPIKVKSKGTVVVKVVTCP